MVRYMALGWAALLFLAGRAAAQKPKELLPEPAITANAWSLSNTQNAAVEIVPADAPGQTKAARIQIRTPNPAQFWTIQWMQSAPGAVAKGSALRLRFWARSATRNPMVAVYEHAAEPYEKLLSAFIALTPEWKEYGLVFAAPRDIPAQWAGVRFQMAHKAGEIELTGISLEDWGVAPNPAPNSFGLDPYGGQPQSDASWWKAAEERIEKIRKGDLKVRVVDAAGKPVPDAKVQIVQKKHQFRFGTAIASDPLFSKTLDGDKYREAIRNYFNCVVFENQMKWAGEDWFPPGTADRMLRWCEAYRLPVRGHCLLWANYEHLPKAKQGLRGEALRKAIQDHVADYATRNKGKVYVWDAVNEAVTNRQIIEELGGEGILAETFQWARKADPKARLAYNEFDILNNQAGAHDAHRAAAAGIIKRLLAAKAPINALGIQAHMKLPLTPGYRLEAILNEWAQFGLPIEITEYDLTVPDDAVHAAYLKEFMTAVFSHPAVDSFVMWGFWEGAHWLAEQGGAMIRKDWTPRPAMQVYQDLVFKQWRTNAEGKTNEQGEVSFRVFFGDHEIAALKDNLDSRGTIRVERKGDAAQTVTIRLQ